MPQGERAPITGHRTGLDFKSRLALAGFPIHP
jgi:hypothetical protein